MTPSGSTCVSNLHLNGKNWKCSIRAFLDFYESHLQGKYTSELFIYLQLDENAFQMSSSLPYILCLQENKGQNDCLATNVFANISIVHIYDSRFYIYGKNWLTTFQ